MTIKRTPIPKKARNRDAVPWRINIDKELTADEMQALAGVFLDGTTHHLLIQGNVYPGITQIEGDFWAPTGRGKDLSQVAKRWALVEERLPELLVGAVLEYRVPGALLDPQPDVVLDVQDLSDQYRPNTES